MSNPYPISALGLGAIKEAMVKAKKRELEFRHLVEITQAEVEVMDEEWDSYSFLSQIFLHNEEWKLRMSLNNKLMLFMKTEEKFHKDYMYLKDVYEKEKARIAEHCRQLHDAKKPTMPND